MREEIDSIKEKLNTALEESGGDARKLAKSYKKIYLQIEDLREDGKMDRQEADKLLEFVGIMRSFLPYA